ncbi:MAG: AMP-binding protein [bacterium]
MPDVEVAPPVLPMPLPPPLDAARTVADLVTAVAARTPDRTALVDGERRIDWRVLDRQVEVAAAGLRSRGVRAGDRVAVQLPSTLEFVQIYLAGLRAGATVVPINPTYTRPELERVLAESRATVLVTASVAALAGAEELLAAGTGLTTVVAVLPPSSADTPPDATISLIALTEAALTDAAPTAPAGDDAAGPQPEDIGVLLFTSGTGGRPKGAMLSHRALLANLAQSRAVVPAPIGPDDVVLVATPLFHIYGLNAGLGAAWAAEARVVLLDRFDVETSLRIIAAEGVTVLLGAPAMFAAWAASPNLAEAVSGVRFAVSGSAPLPASLVARFAEVGVPLHEGYGLTEAAPAVASNAVRADGSSRLGEPKPGSVGAPLPGVEVGLRDADGDAVEADDAGLVTVRGANLFSGYWPDGAGGPDSNGWFVTGDLAYADDDGDLFLVGRDSEMVLVNGFNVYPGEVEAVLAGIDGVADVAVLGVPDAATGEAVLAFVVPEPGAVLDPQQILTSAARSLARFKWPQRVEVVDALPHTVTGKVQKWQLRADANADARGAGAA